MKEKVIGILKAHVDELADVEITDSTKLITSGYIESFDVINLLAIFEEEFGIQLSIEKLEFEDFNTVPQIVALIEKEKK